MEDRFAILPRLTAGGQRRLDGPAPEARRHARRWLSRALGRSAARRADMFALANLAPLSSGYVPWSTIAMRPSGVTAVLDDIVLRNRTRIVECGAGVTTLYIARLLRTRSGHLWSIEHDRQWADFIAAELAREQLSQSVTLIVAPLTAAESQPDALPWYARDILEEALGDARFDLLIVDGPPAWTPDISSARYPAVPFFAPRLAEDWTIILDDLRRAAEDEIAARWESELGVPFKRQMVRGGIAVAHSRSGPVA